ncbi:MAG: SufD family Fe-S cluster assembly protein [Actinomycetota bacterium]
MNEQFGQAHVADLPGDVDRRRAAAEAAVGVGLPSTETEEWRYSPIGDLESRLDDLSPVLSRPDGIGADDLAAVVADGHDGYADLVDRSATVFMVDGWVIDVTVEPGWAEKGLTIEVLSQAAAEAEGGESTLFDHLHRAFGPETLSIRTSQGLTVREPIVIVNHQMSAARMTFPHIVVEAADASDVQVVEFQTSAQGFGLSVPMVEIDVAQAARVRYQTHQDLLGERWQLARQISSVGAQSTLTCGIAAFGARYARVRTDSRLVGRGATGNLVAAYYGDGEQVHDFRTFQHHDDRDGRSDLLFKGAQDDTSGSVYTGLIHIHPGATGTNAFQTNRNIKLSPDAWAWSVPNLEIENNDVHCSHASTVSPLDTDQQFYLGSRGVPPVASDRLIVAGFFDEVIGRLPVESVHDAVRRRISNKLDRRTAS